MKHLAFIDESFDSFFNLRKDDGYYCMGVFLIPEHAIDHFTVEFLKCRSQLAHAKGMPDDGRLETELKSKHLRTLPVALRRSVTGDLIAEALRIGAFVGGFYTSTIGYVNYMVRSDAAGEKLLNPCVHDPERIRVARDDIRARRATEPAESLMIGDIARAVGSMVLRFCHERGLSFQIHYDPRTEAEDLRVFQRIADLLEPIARTEFQDSNVFLGCSRDLQSRDSAGLQMADHVTRDLKALFEEHPRLLTDASSADLITAEFHPSRGQIITKIGDQLYKWGDSIPMAQNLVQTIFAPDAPFTLADYHNILLKQRVTCYSNLGEARIVNFEQFSFENMVD